MLNPFSTVKELRELINNKEVTQQEVTDFYYKRLQEFNGDLNAAVEIFDKPALSPEPQSGILSGIPCLIKDNVSQKGQITAAASNILKNYRSPYDATVTKRIKSAGSIILGRANCDEFAMGSTGEYSAYGATKNPWNTNHTPGGSSSGSAAAVAAGMVPWALGTETGGSVRQPAAFCGLVGMYPTYGLHSRFGVLAFGSSLDQPSPIARTVYDCALITSAIAGHDPSDSTSLPEPKRDYTRSLDGKLPKDLVIGVIKDSLESEGVSGEIKTAFSNSVKELETLGAKIKYIDIPDLKYGISVYFIISRAEAASNLSRIDGSTLGDRKVGTTLDEMHLNTREEGFGPEVKRRILMGNYVLSAMHRDVYEKAMHVRSMIRAEFERAFSEVDLLMSPTTSTLPFELGKDIKDPLKVYMADYFTTPNCVAGLPAISIPCGKSKDGLPIGMQFIGPRLSEELLFRVAYAYEQEHPFFKDNPAGY